MQTKKMSLANIQGKLSRAEMKQVMAGSGTCGCIPLQIQCVSPFEWGSCNYLNSGTVGHLCCALS